MDMNERATFSSKQSCEDKFLGDCLKITMKPGSEKQVPNKVTASNTVKSMRILMSSSQGVKLTLTAVWAHI